MSLEIPKISMIVEAEVIKAADINTEKKEEVTE